MYIGQVECSFGCPNSETQQHIFEVCKHVREGVHLKEGVRISNIFGDLDLQKTAMIILIQIEQKRLKLKQNMEPACKYVQK